MSRKYGAGLQLVVATLIVSSMICGYGAYRRPHPSPPAAQDLGASSRPLGPFRLEERSGRSVTADDLADRVAIASFIFTRCPLSCPRITGVMQGLQTRLAGTGVLLVSISVDPQHDTPEVLRRYAESYRASPDRWWFLTGPRATIHDLVRDRFQLGIEEAPGPVGVDTESILHSDRLVLIDHGKMVGYFDSNDAGALDSLTAKARRLDLPAWVRALPSINAGLNALSACLLIAGWILILRHRPGLGTETGTTSSDRDDPKGLWAQPTVRAHVACMVSAICASTLFLAGYLYYHHRAGSKAFPHGGPLRVAYLSILLSHTLLATLSVPLILATVRRAWTGRLDRHAVLASFTLPIWLYVSATGVVIYLMLYHLPVPSIGGSPGL